MGAKYAPSVANLFMSFWEDEAIFQSNIPELRLYRRYIDDILIIWAGTPDSFLEFLAKIGTNRFGISFSESFSYQQIYFLDLTLFREGNKLLTRTFFKDVDRNGYIPLTSCHHPRWLGGIPKSQLLRIRRNCSNLSDYNLQANIILKRFQEKGYSLENLERIKQTVGEMDRNDLFRSREKREQNDYSLSFFTGFNRQYRDLEKIVKRHWPLLLQDNDLKKVLPKQPRFIYTKPPTLRLQLAHNVIDPPRKVLTFLDSVGFYSCGRCVMCRTSKFRTRKTTHFSSLVDGRSYEIKKCITCSTTHVTYLLSCPCNLQYVGRTTRQLGTRLKEHVNRIKKGYKFHGLSNHFKIFHNQDPSLLTFCGIDRVEEHWRGSNLRQNISQNETQWIHRLRTLNPLGLNIELDLNCFLSNW